MSWERQPLGSICEIVSGITKDSKKQGDDYREVPYLRVANVQRLRLDLSEVKTIPARESAIASYHLEPGDILLNEGGDRDKLGRGWIWQGQISECIHLNHVFRARIRNGKAIPKWVAYFANTDEARAYFQATGKQTTNLASISKKNLSALPVPLPPVDVQEEIVAEIDTQLSLVDETVATLQAIEAKLKLARASILKAAVAGRLTGEGLKANIECKPYFVKDICLSKPSNGKSVPTGDGFPVLRLTAMKDGKIDAAEIKLGAWTEESAKPYAVQPDDFFVMRGNGSLSRVGDAAIATDSGITAAFPDTMIRLQPDPQLCLPAYLLLCWKSPDMRSQIERSAKTTAGIYKINQRDISGYRVTLPDIESQRSIFQEVECRFSVLDQVESTVNASLRRCGQLRQAVLKRAFGR